LIQVKYDRFYCRLTVKGHAEFAPHGEDLVCSAVTILVHTLEANVEDMELKGFAVSECCVENGYAKIRCKPYQGYEDMAATKFSAVCVGFELLAEEFPEYISYKITG